MRGRFAYFAEALLHSVTRREKSMRIPKPVVGGWILLAAVGIWGWCCLSPIRAAAQSQGNNTVYNSAGTPSPTGSPAFIDASTFSGTDICTVINGILTSTLTTYPAAGVVVDARGVVPLSGSGGPPNSQNCSVNPFAGVTVPSTILLPSSTIVLTTTPWVLPSNTRIIGTGFYTQIVAGFTTGDVIDMCSSTASSACSGISIEHLSVQSAQICSTNPSNTLYGIVNYYAQSSSYIDDVGICGMGLTGLRITSNATNSGPYSNLNIATMMIPSTPYCSGGLGSCPACVDIEAQTRGLHGITCIGTRGVGGNAGNDLITNGDAGIYANFSNNTVEDVHIEGFFDGIEVGDSTSNVGNVVLANVTGGYGAARTRNTIHICGSDFTIGSQFGNCLNYPPSGNSPNGSVTVLGATDVNNGGGTNYNGSTSIQDDVTNTSIAAPVGVAGTTGVTTAIYAVGAQVGSGSGGISRFSTNPSYITSGSSANHRANLGHWSDFG
jgi:hypothetical protein